MSTKSREVAPPRCGWIGLLGAFIHSAHHPVSPDGQPPETSGRRGTSPSSPPQKTSQELEDDVGNTKEPADAAVQLAMLELSTSRVNFHMSCQPDAPGPGDDKSAKQSGGALMRGASDESM